MERRHDCQFKCGTVARAPRGPNSTHFATRSLSYPSFQTALVTSVLAQVMAEEASVDMTYAYGTFLTTKTGTSYT